MKSSNFSKSSHIYDYLFGNAATPLDITSTDAVSPDFNPNQNNSRPLSK